MQLPPKWAFDDAQQSSAAKCRDWFAITNKFYNNGNILHLHGATELRCSTPMASSVYQYWLFTELQTLEGN